MECISKLKGKGKVKEICLKTRDHWITLEKFTTEVKISFQEILYCSRWLGFVHLSISTIAQRSPQRRTKDARADPMLENVDETLRIGS